MRIIRGTVDGIYLTGSGVPIAAAGAHDAVLRLTFAGSWAEPDMNFYVTFRDTNAEYPTVVAILPTDAVQDLPNTFDVLVPAKPLELEGRLFVTVSGYKVVNDVEVEEASQTATAYYKILRSDSALAEDGSISATLAQQLQNSINKVSTGIERVLSSVAESEAWARGTRDGNPVEFDDPTYRNNSLWYAQEANASKQSAAGSAEAAAESADAAAQSAEDARNYGDSARYNVRYTQQTLTPQEQAQARANIGAASESAEAAGAVRYDVSQTLTASQQTQARTNIGATDQASANAYADQTAADTVNGNAVKYSAPQSLTLSQQAQARANIGAGTSSFSGSYNDLNEKPTIPTTTGQLENTSDYQTGDDVDDAIGAAAVRYDTAQDLTPEQKAQARSNIGAGLGAEWTLLFNGTVGSNTVKTCNISGYSALIFVLEYATAGTVFSGIWDTHTVATAAIGTTAKSIQGRFYSKSQGTWAIQDMDLSVNASGVMSMRNPYSPGLITKVYGQKAGA